MTDEELRQHHVSRLTGKVIVENPHRTLKTWIDGMDDAEEVEELVDRIFAAVGDEIEETLEQPEFEADMDDQIAAWTTEADQ